MARRLLIIGACCAFAFACSAAPAFAVKVGQSAQSLVNGTGCTAAVGCDFIQFQDGDTNYSMPFDGVVTAYKIRSGSAAPTSADKATLRIYRPGGGAFTLIGESAADTFSPFGTSDSYFPARIAVKSGDRIGTFVHYAANIAWTYSSSGGDAVGALSVHPNVGDTVLPLSILATGSQRLNVEVILEPDIDHDGYGDETQDLCPGDSLHGASGCTGTTIGSTFLNPTAVGTNAACGAPPCIIFNSAFGSQSTAAPVSGVIVRWRMRAPTMFTTVAYKLRVLRPTGGTKLAPAGSSAPIVPASNGTDPPTLRPDTRLPISAGDFIGLESSTGQNHPVYMNTGAGTESALNPAPADGVSGFALFGFNLDTDFLYNADIEPDVDGDGFGDVTQDLCPSDPAIQTKCPAPQVTGLVLSPKKFKVKKKGAVLRSSRKTPSGSQVKFTLTRGAQIQFVITQRLKGKRKGKKCVKKTSKNAHAKSCTYFGGAFYAFKRELPAGAQSIVFSGRIQKGKRTVTLKAGRYVLTASPANATGGVGSTVKTEFVVAK